MLPIHYMKQCIFIIWEKLHKIALQRMQEGFGTKLQPKEKKQILLCLPRYKFKKLQDPAAHIKEKSERRSENDRKNERLF